MVVEDLSEVVRSCIYNPVSALLIHLHCRGNSSTFHRLFGKEIILHPLYPRTANRIRQYPWPVLEDDSPLDTRVPLFETNALLPVASAHVHEDWCIVCCVAGILAAEVDYVEPGRKRRELQFHEAVECAGMRGACVHPFVEIDACVLPFFEGCAGFPWAGEEAV